MQKYAKIQSPSDHPSPWPGVGWLG